MAPPTTKTKASRSMIGVMSTVMIVSIERMLCFSIRPVSVAVSLTA